VAGNYYRNGFGAPAVALTDSTWDQAICYLANNLVLAAAVKTRGVQCVERSSANANFLETAFGAFQQMAAIPTAA